MSAGQTEYQNMGSHAEEITGGRMIAPGETVKLTAKEQEDPHNKRLIDEGVFEELPKESSSGAKKQEGGDE